MRRARQFALREFAVLIVIVTAIGTGLPLVSGGAAAKAAPVFNVRDYGAKGNGTANDTPAINKAIAAASKAGGGTVLVPAGKYLGGGSIHMMSNVTLDLAAGSTILGASSGYDAPEPNSFSQYQDF